MAHILVVDDEPLNRELIRAYLEGADHSIAEADSGEGALAWASENDPDIVLLDVMMPGMNGFETTRKLKELARGHYLPIILITALDDAASRILGLKSGADEFLSKPVDRQELSVRVNNLLALREKEHALLQKNIQHAELHRLKDELASMIVHDIKNPLAAIAANLQFVLEAQAGLDQDSLDALEEAEAAAKRVLDLAGNLLEIARMEGSSINLRRTRLLLHEVVTEVLASRMMSGRLREISLVHHEDQTVEVEADRDLLIRILENILDNALRHADSGGCIEITYTMSSAVQLRIGNTGTPIPVALRPHLFEKFARGASARRMNQGLGLYFCRMALEAHGGRIWIEETPAFPTIFACELPRAT